MMKVGKNPPAVFNRVIQSDTREARKVIGEALVYFKKIQKYGLAHDISEFNFRLALDETIENAISHGNSYDPGKKIYITIKGFKNKLDMTIEDEGAGFNPEPDPERSLMKNIFSSHGRGLCLLHKIACIEWNKKGNCIKVVLAE